MIASGAGLFLGAGLMASRLASLDVSLWLRVPGIFFLLVASAHGVHLLEWVGHEGIHLLLHRNPYVSIAVGTFFAAMTAFSAVGQGIAHWTHHRFTNQSSDPDAQIYSRFRLFFSRLLFARVAASRAHMTNTVKLALGKPIGLGYTLPFGARAQRGLAWMNIGFLIAWLGTYAAVAVFHPQVILFAIVLPVAIGLQLSGLRGYVEHAGTGLGTFRDTRTCTSRTYTWLLFGNNYHLEHHLYPSVPCYRLGIVHRILEADGFFARCDSPIETSILGALVHTTSVSQYPTPAFGDLSDDPFHPTLEPHASAA
jgi:beta-carotene hydroxylase